MAILHEYPLNIVEHIGLREFSASLQPLFKMVCRNTLKRDILKIYDYERGKTFMEGEKFQVELQSQLLCGLQATKGDSLCLSKHIILMTLGLWKAGL